jgi:hypothetical protein
MYIVIQTDDATKQAITKTFSSIDELHTWTQSQLPVPHEKDINAILETILKPEIFKSILLHVENEDDKKDIKEPSTNTVQIDIGAGFQQVCFDQPAYEINHALFKMSMDEWVSDKSTLKMEQVNFSVEKEKAALKTIQTRFFDLYCKSDVRSYKIYKEDIVFNDVHKFVWVLALNFPSIFFTNDPTTVEHIEFLKTCRTTNKAANLLRYYSDWDDKSLGNIWTGLDSSKCFYIFWFLYKMRSMHSLFMTTEAFVFKTLFYYYYANKTITDDLVSLWIGLFLEEKITKTATGSIQSSELQTMFRMFLSDVLKSDDTISEIYCLYTKFDEYINPKTFARALKSHNITDITRKSTGIFYTGIARRYVAKSKDASDIELTGFNKFQINYENVNGSAEFENQYAIWKT